MIDRKSTYEEVEAEDGRKERIVREGQEATRILEEPILKRFFAESSIQAINEFASLQINTPEMEMRALLMKFKALEALRSSLEQYVLRAADEVIKGEKTETEF